MGSQVKDDLAPRHRPGDSIGVGHLALDDRGGAGDVLREARGEVVEHDDVTAGVDERADEVRADEPGAAGYQCPHE